MTADGTKDFNRELVEAIEYHFDIVTTNKAANPNATFEFVINGSNSEGYTKDLDNKPFIYSDNDSFGGTNSLFGGAYTEYYDAFGDLTAKDDLLAPSTVINFDFEGRDIYRLDHRGSDSFLLTADLNEVSYVLQNLEYDFTEVAFRIGEGEVHRYFNPLTGEHNYAGNSIEAMAIVNSDENWVYEGFL